MQKNKKRKKWRRVRLGEVGKIITGKTPSTKEASNFGGQFPFITIPDLKNQRFVIETERTISEIGAQKMRGLKLPPRTVVMSCLATVGETGITTRESFTNQQINAVICDSQIIDYKFLYYIFNYLKKLLKQYDGSVYINISKSKFANLEVEIPSIDMQKRIADILSAFDDKIELNNKISKNLEEMAQAIFKEWFLKNKKSKVKNKKLGEIAIIKYGHGPAFNKLKKNGYPVYGANGIIGYFDSCDFQNRQIIVGCRGVVGNVTLTFPQSTITHNSLIIVPSNSRKIFFYYLLRNQNLGVVVGGSAQPQITINDLEKLEISLHEEKLQDDFEKAIGCVEEKRLLLFCENQKLTALRDLVLSKLMSGKIRV